MAADHSARGSMKTGVKPETVCELQDTNDHRQVERKWRLPISVGELSTLEGRLKNLFQHSVLPTAMDARHSVPHAALSRGDVPGTVCYGVVSSALRTRQRSRSASNALIDYGERRAPSRAKLYFHFSTSGVLDHALNLSISLSAGKETKWDSPSNGE